MARRSGVHGRRVVIGVEKMRDKSARRALGACGAGHPIFTRGETAPVLFAPFATRHMTRVRHDQRDAGVGCRQNITTAPATRTRTSRTSSRSTT